MTVDPQVVMILTGVLLPLVNGLVFKYTSNPNLLRLANAVLAFVVNAVAYALADDGAYVFDHAWVSYLVSSFLTLVVAQVSYLSVYVPLKLTSRPDGILPTDSGIKLGAARTPDQYPAGMADAA